MTERGERSFFHGRRSDTLSPSNLVNAVSQIQQYCVVEETGQEIPSDFLTARGTLAFFLVGAQCGFRECFLLGILLPVAWGTWEEAIPVLRATGEDILGKTLLFFFCFGTSGTVSLALSSFLRRYCRGALSLKAAGALIWGRIMGLAGTGFAFFCAFHATAFFLTPDNVSPLVRAAERFLSDPDSLRPVLEEMREPLRKSALTLIFCPVVFGLFPFFALRIRRLRRRLTDR